MADPPAWLRELPVEPGPPWVTMGVRGLGSEPWLVVDDDYEEQLRAKDATDVAHAFAAEPGTEPAGHEVLELVRDWLAEHGPPITARRVRADDARPGTDATHPLLRAALLVQEDLCLMSPRAEGYVLSAGAVHFPSHWRLEEKAGRPMAAIHAPVRHYPDELETRADRFFDRLARGRVMVRRNVSIHDHDDLDRPEPPETYEAFDGDFTALWVRSERQTLRRLDRSDDVLFTIKTQQCPLPLVRELPAVARGLAAKLRSIRRDHEAAGLPVHAPTGIAEWLTDAIDER